MHSALKAHVSNLGCTCGRSSGSCGSSSR
jgi:hypothetical protein